MTALRRPGRLTAIIPAGGKGRRMQAAFPGVPKIMLPVCRRPMIRRLTESVAAAGIADEIVVVVSPDARGVIEDELRSLSPSYAEQREPLGTAHAVACAADVAARSEYVMVLFADQPLISAHSLRLLVRQHMASGPAITLCTVLIPDFDDWRVPFYDYGRVIRATNNQVERIVEVKNATAAELAVKELNPSLYCFTGAFLWNALKMLNADNAQGEYLLTDVVSLAVQAGERVEAISIDDPRETLGANSPSQLRMLEVVCEQLMDPASPPPR